MNDQYRKYYEEARAQATKAGSSFAKEQWLGFAQEWLKLAEAAEAQQRREAAVVSAK
jgi:hypothetical protein